MQWAPYQLRWLNDQSRMRACVKSRRIGFSEVTSFEAAGRALGLEFVNGRFRRSEPANQNIISASANQVKEYVADVSTHLRVLEKAMPGAIVALNKFSIELRSEDSTGRITHTEIRGLSSNPDAPRGFEGDLVWDECGATPRQEDVWAGAQSVANPTLGKPTGYRVSIVGTPRGDTNFFHSVCRGKLSAKFSVHTVDIYRAVKEGFPLPESLESMRASTTDDKWKQEHECDFLSASQRYIGDTLYDACVFDVDLMPRLDIDCSRYGGNDVGRVNDLSAICKLALQNGKLWQDGITQVERGMGFDDQEKWIGRELQTLTRLCVDASGLGMQYAERMVKAHGMRVEPVTFTSAVKEELATGLKLALERGILRLRKDDTDLRDDVLLLRRQITSAGNVRYDADRSADKGHADRAWALALAVHASGLATKRTEPLTMDAIGPRSTEDARERENAPGRLYDRPRQGGWR